MEKIKTIKRGHALVSAGEFRPDMMKLRGCPVSARLEHFLKLLSRDADGNKHALDRRDLPSLKEAAAILDISAETVCRELNAILSARVYQRPKREAWVHASRLALAA